MNLATTSTSHEVLIELDSDDDNKSVTRTVTGENKYDVTASPLWNGRKSTVLGDLCSLLFEKGVLSTLEDGCDLETCDKHQLAKLLCPETALRQINELLGLFLRHTKIPNSHKTEVTLPTSWLTTTELVLVSLQFEAVWQDFCSFTSILTNPDTVNNKWDILKLRFKYQHHRAALILYLNANHFATVFATKTSVEYFDPYVGSSLKGLGDDVKTVVQNLARYFGVKKAKYYFPKKQKNNVACGLYALRFIEQRLRGQIPEEIFADESFNDRGMEILRQYYFQKNNWSPLQDAVASYAGMHLLKVDGLQEKTRTSIHFIKDRWVVLC